MRRFALARWTFRAVGIVVTIAFLVGAARLVWPQPGVDEQPADTYRQLAFVRAAIDRGADVSAQQQFPEGYFFLNALYGLAWVQAGRTDPSRRDEALRESRWALQRLESEQGRAAFDPSLRPGHGIFWAGWTNWLHGAILTLGGTWDAEDVWRFSDRSAEIARAFKASETPFLEAYPGQAWPVDSTVAIASLRLHDRLLGTWFDGVAVRWLAAVRQRLDPATGLLPHQVSPKDGSLLESARATSQTVILRFLPEIDPDFAKSQYQNFRARFLSYPAGFGPAIREYPEGTDGPGDVDSGPLLAGISLSATVVGLGAARVNGDTSLATALGSAGELLGAPLTLPGTKRYALGLLPIGDDFLVWSATARPLVAAQPTGDSDLPWWWRVPWLALLTAGALTPWLRPLYVVLRRKTTR
ncbi:hypothetical protein JK358_25340 [Nocardia sp. 2]|uniref:DUF2264 domain-containing protein n=1 Tax=Nocardia acididurans TaxID=2802282 RepID=A0ABS1MCH3_9NOCA|nr:hypothetical protein [Nocardia acididurans]MBL1077730.1 hypothetical protein [Nocardia acididurans]